MAVNMMTLQALVVFCRQSCDPCFFDEAVEKQATMRALPAVCGSGYKRSIHLSSNPPPIMHTPFLASALPQRLRNKTQKRGMTVCARSFSANELGKGVNCMQREQ